MKAFISAALLSSFALIFFAPELLAHEYWLEPEKFKLVTNEHTDVHLYVGDGLIKDREEKPYESEKTPRFSLISASQTIDLRTSLVPNSMPLYNFSNSSSGLHFLALERSWSYITLEPTAFEDYLKTDGMEYVIGERKKLGESGKQGRERYRRFLKSLLQVGGKNDNTFSKNLGLKLEIIPLSNPYKKKVGDSIRFRVLFDNKPLADRSVFADNRDGATQRQITNAKGEVSFKLDRKGLWLIRLVTMERCSDDCQGADWQSSWGALTFGL